MVNTRNYLKKRKIKKKWYGRIDIRMCEEKTTKIKRVWKNHRQNMTNKRKTNKKERLHKRLQKKSI